MAENSPTSSMGGEGVPRRVNVSRTNRRKPPLRQPLSCVPCRQRKAKCDRNQPCETCRRRQCPLSCVYTTTPSKPVADDAGDLRARVEFLEQLLLSSVQNSESARALSPDQDPDPNPDPDPGADLHGQNLPQLTTPASTEPDGPEGGVSVLDTMPGHLPTHTNRPKQAFVGSLSATEDVKDGSNVRYRVDKAQWNAVLPESLRHQQHPGSLLGDEVSSTAAKFPFAMGTTGGIDSLLATLPPRRHCDYLIHQYFTCFSPLFHILHDPTFHAEYATFTQNPRAAQLSWLALLFTLLALAITTLDDQDAVLLDLGSESEGGNNIRPLATRFRAGAMNALAADQFLIKHSLTSLQALVLLIYAINHSEGADQSMALLGMTLNIAIAMGCHVDPKDLGVTCIEAEQRRRCWHGIVMLHMLQIVSFGNVDILQLKYCEVDLPADVNDVDILPDKIVAASTSPTQMSYMLFKLRLHHLAYQVCDRLFRGHELTREVVMALDGEIAAEQKMWDNQYLADGGPNMVAHHHKAHWNILHGYAHQLYLLLHRPFFHMHRGDMWPGSRARCVASGKALLDIHQQFYDLPHFQRYRWYLNGLGSFYAFHGAVTIFATIFEDGSASTRLEYGAAFLACVSRFETLALRSNICAQSLPVLQHLRRLLLAQDAGEGVGVVPVSSVYRNHTFQQVMDDWLLPNKWLSPGSVDWGLWDNYLDS